MKPIEFVSKYYAFAKEAEKEKGVSAIAILSQSALETGWGDHAPNNMMFGVKDTDGINGNEQLVTTFEYSRRPNCTPQQAGLISITRVDPVKINGIQYYKYTGKDYFRKYPSPKESFADHMDFFRKNSRYAKALTVANDPYSFLDEIAKAGYATAPNYSELLKSVAKTIEKEIAKL